MIKNTHTALCILVSLSLGAAIPAFSEDNGFTSIFNGQDLSGWGGKEQFWRVENGYIVGETTEANPTSGNTFLIWRDGEVDDFELKFRYRFASDWVNSGVQIRSRDLGDYVVAGYQSDIASDDWITGIVFEERGRGILARRGQKVEIGDGANNVTVIEEFASSEELGTKIHKNDWNDYHIIARGNHITHSINGHKMVDLTDKGETDARDSGIIAIQLHSGPPMTIHFKDIELKRLPLSDDRKKIVMVAGTRSHGYMAHEHNAGILLFKKILDKNAPNVLSTTYHNGWPSDPTAFDNADGILIYSNGGGGHPAIPHLKELDELMKKGVGLANIHYAVEVPKGEPGDYFLEWVGGYFETHWSVNPHWVTQDTQINTSHPIARGVGPYEIDDEWYFHMRFRPDMEGVSPILSAVPPESVFDRPDGAHSNNPDVRETKGEHHELIWAHERDNGGRGFGFTGGHWHWNWGHPDQLRIALNALLWVAGAEVPEGGVPFEPLSIDDLEANMDYDQPNNFNRDRILNLLEQWNK